MNNRILITETQLKEQSPIGTNVDSKFLNSRIWNCQQKYIKTLLGQDLYNDVLMNFTAGTLSTAYSTLLLDYITPVLVNYCVYDVLPVIHFKINNAGVNYRQDNNIIPATLSEINSLADKFKNEAEYYAEQTTKHLFFHPELYPLYFNGNVDMDKVRPVMINYNSGIYVGNKNYQQSSIGIFKNGENQ